MRKPAGCEIFTLYLDLGGNYVDIYYVKFIEPHTYLRLGTLLYVINQYIIKEILCMTTKQ